MSNINDLLAELRKRSDARVVSCPLIPKALLEADTGVTIETGDTLGLVFAIAVPKSGVIYSATFIDLDAEGSQVDIEIYKRSIADQATDAAYAPDDAEALTFLTELSFVSFDDHGVFQTSEITNIGKAYSVPDGKFYNQGVVRAGQTIAVGKAPRIQYQILSDDPDFQEV